MGTPVPKTIADAPVLEDAYQVNIHAAFWKLSTCRSIGMGVGAIPWDSIDRWAIRHGYSDDEIEYETFVYLIQQLDEEFLEYQNAKAERERGKHGKPSTVRRPSASPRGRSSRRRR